MQPSESVGFPVSSPPATLPQVLERFGDHQRLSVRQKKRWLDMLLNWESKNSFGVYDEDGEHVLQVKEDGSGLGNFLKRILLRTMRPFTSTVYDNPVSRPLFTLQRPFRWYFARLEVRTLDGRLVGAVQRKWSWLRRIYVLEDAAGRELAQLFGPILRPWTFEIRQGERELGLVQKKWSGLGTEFFSDADNFWVEMARVDDPRLKVLAFAAVILIDVVHFEQSKSNAAALLGG
jgi:uncharacterized protein YxjI